MKINSIELENIRNIKRMQLLLSAPLIVIAGKNAQGKTTILEAIYFLSVGKSARKGPESSIITAGMNKGRIKGEFNAQGEKTKIEFVFGTKKTPKLNGKVSKISEIVGEASAVLFTADDLAIIESPQKRRRFLNVLLSQINKEYLLSLIEYQHVLKRRNKLLFLIKSERAKKEELTFWNDKLAKLAKRIVVGRKDIINKINEIFKQSNFFKDKRLKIVYSPSVSEEEEVKVKLKSREEKEIILCQTTIGPHRDNINFYLDKLNLSFHGSRGERRGAIVELKRAEIELMEKEKGELPILLLDDVLSELDSENKKHIIEAIDKEQTIITTTNEKELGSFVKKAKVYRIENGEIKEK